MMKDGKREAFRKLVEMNKRRVFCLAYDLTGNIEDAEDLSQEVFIRAYRNFQGFRGDSAPFTWLYTIAVRTWIDMHRTRNARISRACVPMDEEIIDPGCILGETPGEHPEYRAEYALLRGHIEHALDSLSPRERSVVSLKYLQDLKLAEIATVHSISEGAVKNHLYSALRKMRRKLAFLLERR